MSCRSTFPGSLIAYCQRGLISPVEQGFLAQSGVCRRVNAWSWADWATNPHFLGSAANSFLPYISRTLHIKRTTRRTIHKPVIRVSTAKARFVRTAVTRFPKMLRDASMAGLVKLRCGVRPKRQSPVRAVREDGPIV
jgi:hypothetical protein